MDELGRLSRLLLKARLRLGRRRRLFDWGSVNDLLVSVRGRTQPLGALANARRGLRPDVARDLRHEEQYPKRHEREDEPPRRYAHAPPPLMAAGAWRRCLSVRWIALFGSAASCGLPTGVVGGVRIIPISRVRGNLRLNRLRGKQDNFRGSGPRGPTSVPIPAA